MAGESLLHKLLQPSSNYLYWIVLSLLFRGVLFFTQIHVFHPGSIWGITEDDTFTYLNPIDTLVKTGNYSPDFRMPGYGAFYLPLAFFFSKTIAYNLLL